MTERILIDTGPVVALLDENEHHHQACAMQAQQMPEVVYTCWPDVTEACYLLRRRPDANFSSEQALLTLPSSQ